MLAEEGPRGLSHLKVDRHAGLPDGSTSFYYRTRAALLHGVADQLVRYDAEAFTEIFKDVPNSSARVIARMLAGQILAIGSEPQLSRTRARLELTMSARRDPGIASGFQQISESYRALAERLVMALHHDNGTEMDPALCDEQTSVLMAYLGGQIFALANDSPDVLTRDDIERQIHAVIMGVAAQRAARQTPSTDSNGVRAK
ncbi:TetR/AcrR family transcriptional regulator [Mycolicibacterium sp. 018/SC-01/001]|uniref:TetR/AcrR family transcriptional regulator n=1 Tax=Mycolicibacterium sp. 018/SC-01/001 TaxID=2592069 RepID=UPI00117FDBB5|nr:TetR/AcrR family transcriptional regulator [Mycolicibacterium sp. 018/SC-01/001]TRW87993.1 TetR/AcrR family transcriptional regulator [Mycolicibacterium sp. 018/SC-01/001]